MPVCARLMQSHTDPIGMIKMLEDMAETFKNPETVGELDFNTKYGSSIRSAIGRVNFYGNTRRCS